MHVGVRDFGGLYEVFLAPSRPIKAWELNRRSRRDLVVNSRGMRTAP